MSDFGYKKTFGGPTTAVSGGGEADVGFGSFRGADAPASVNAGAGGTIQAGHGAGGLSAFGDWRASAGLLGDRFSPVNSMLSGLFASDVNAGLRDVEKTQSGGNFFGFGEGHKLGVKSNYGDASGWAGQGGGVGWSSWAGDKDGTSYRGHSGGAGVVNNAGYDWNLLGFGQSADLNAYRGVGGSAYSMDGPDKTGYGAEGSYTPLGLANSSVGLSAGPLGNAKLETGNAYLDRHSVSGQAYRDADGKYVATGNYNKRTGADNVQLGVNTPVGTVDAKVGHVSQGFDWTGDAFYDSKTGSFGAGGQWAGGPDFKVQNASVDGNFGGGAVKVGGSVGSWDPGDTYSGRVGWDAKTQTGYAEGAGNWGGSTLENAKVYGNLGNGAATYDASVGKFITGGHDLRGKVGYNAKDGVVEASGGYRGGGAQLENAAVNYGVRGVGSVDAKLGGFSNDLMVKDVNAKLGLRQGEISVGTIDGGGWRANDFAMTQKNDLLGTTTTAGFEQLGSTNSISGARVSYDLSSLDKAALRGGFDDLAIGGYSGKNLRAGFDGPGGVGAHASVGSFNQGFSGQGGSFELSREKGLALGLEKGRFDHTVVNDVNLDAKLGGLYEAKAHLGEGYFQHFAARDMKAGLNLDKGLYASLRDGEYSYLGGKDLDVSSKLLGGAVGNQLKVGEASGLGVNIGKLDYNTTLQNANLTAYDVGAHGLKAKDVDYKANVGDLSAQLGAKELSALDLNIGKLDAHTKNFGLTGNAQLDKARLDAVNIKDGHAGIGWNGKEVLGASGSYRAGLGLDQAKADYDLLSGRAGAQFKNLSAGAQLSDAKLNLFGHNLALPDMGGKLNASGGANVDLMKGAANANLSLAGSSVNFAGHNLTLGDWAQASAGVNLSQGAANVNLGGRNGVGADMNLSQGNLDLNVFGHKVDVDEGVRSVGRGIANAGRAVGSGIASAGRAVGGAARSAWNALTGW